MSVYFDQYLDTFHRVRLSEMLQYHSIEGRKATARASLIVNPMTGMPYPEPVNEAQLGSYAAPTLAAAPGG